MLHLLLFPDFLSLFVIYGFWSAVACWINLICIFNTACSLPPKWNQRMPGEFTPVLMNLPWKPHLISELSMTQVMWLFPTCLLLVGKQQADVCFFFFSPYITFKEGAIHLRSLYQPKKCSVVYCLANVFKRDRKSMSMNLKIWALLFIINVSDGNHSVKQFYQLWCALLCLLEAAQTLISGICCLVNVSVLLCDIILKQNGNPKNAKPVFVTSRDYFNSQEMLRYLHKQNFFFRQKRLWRCSFCPLLGSHVGCLWGIRSKQFF